MITEQNAGPKGLLFQDPWILDQVVRQLLKDARRVVETSFLDGNELIAQAFVEPMPGNRKTGVPEIFLDQPLGFAFQEDGIVDVQRGVEVRQIFVGAKLERTLTADWIHGE